MILILLYPKWSSIRERLWDLKTCFYISALSLNSEDSLKDATPQMELQLSYSGRL